MAFLKGSLAGPGFVILNAIRALNIIVFLDIIAASVVMLVKISLLTSFFFFQAVSHVMTISVSIFLIVSELPFFRGYFDRNWPLLGQDSGFFTLAVTMLILGVGVLGSLNTPATSQESLGLPFWRIIISAGILAMVMSVVNVIATFVFANRSTGVSARHVRLYGAVASQKVIPRSSSNSSQRSLQLSIKREDSLPLYTSQIPERRQSSRRSETRFPLKISSPVHLTDTASSKYSRDSSGVTVPNLAHHPAMYSTRI